MRIAIVHDWLPTIGGAERVLKQLLKIFPNSDVFTLVDLLTEQQKAELGINRPVFTSFLNKSKIIREKYRYFLPLMPFAIEQFDLSNYDIIISNSYAVAKGVIVHPHQYHVCYCCSPMRYAWDMKFQYLGQLGQLNMSKNIFARILLHYMRIWDVSSSCSVDQYVTLSYFVANRIEKSYRRNSVVIYPPVDVECFNLSEVRRSYFVTVSRLIGYKRIDLIIQAFSKLPMFNLVIIGDGPEMGQLRKLSTGLGNIKIEGNKSQAEVSKCVAEARAFIFVAKEDFGIAPVEAQAAGVPVIAFSEGGASETIIDGITGVLFSEQTAEGLINAVDRFCRYETRFDPKVIRANALRFSEKRFCELMKLEVSNGYSAWRARYGLPGGGRNEDRCADVALTNA